MSGSIQTCCSEARNSLHPTPFDGTQDWETYKIQFDAVAKFNGWDDYLKACALVASLRDEAITVLYSLEEKDLTNYERVSHALTKRFGKMHLAKKFRNDLHEKKIKQEAGVSLQKFEADLTRIIRLAYPQRSLAQLESIRLSSFVNGIECYRVLEEWIELMVSILNGEVRTTEEMLEYALEREQDFY